MKKTLLCAAGFVAALSANAQTVTGPSSSQSPYVTPFAAGVKITSILSAGDRVNGYRMAGIPDGAGAFDNGDGTFTMLVNHEIGNTGGVARAHGSTGAFVSKWIINKSTFAVISGGDLIQRVNLWNGTGYTTYYNSNPSTSAAFGRFCSGDLAPVSAFYNAATGLGTTARIFMNGEESGAEGRGFAHIASGPNAGDSYELPYLGKYSWENAMANPGTGDKTVVVGTDDATPGQVYFYIGTKTATGTDIQKAGLTNGKLYGPVVSGMLLETSASIPAAGTAFTMADLGNVSGMTGATLQTASNNLGVTQFLRPEDGAWDPMNPADFYFVTTNGFGSPSRLWRMRFNNIADLTQGGTITAVLDGTEGQQMLDNIGIDNFGHILMVEDVGGNPHLGKTWQYTIATDALVQIASHDPTRFVTGGANFLTQDEEASGIFDAQDILGAGMFLLVDQAHYSIAGEVFEGGQILAMYNPDSYNSNPEVSVQGGSQNIIKGDMTPNTLDNTDFGNMATDTNVTKTFTIQNAGPASLSVSAITIAGTNASEFTLVGAPTLPLSIAANGNQTITVKFAPTAVGLRTAKITVTSNDFDEKSYDFAIQGVGLNPNPTTGIASVPTLDFAKLFPNPTGNMATVAFTLSKAEKVSVTMYDVNGKVVIPAINNSFNAGEQKVDLNTSSLANGVYFVQLTAGSVTTKMRLIVAH